MKGDLRDKVRKFVIRNFLFGEASGLLDNSSLVEEGLLDSRNIGDLILFLEEEFSLRIGAEDLTPENFDSVAAIVEFLDRRLYRPEPIFPGIGAYPARLSQRPTRSFAFANP